MESTDGVPTNEQDVLNKIFDLVSEHEELKEKLAFNEEMIYTLETELSGLKKLRVLDFMSSDAHLCKTCREIKCPKERQLWLLNKIFNKVLFKKPKDLLHLSKIFHHLEIMVQRNRFVEKFTDLKGEKCENCNQITDPENFAAFFDKCVLEEIENLKGIHSFTASFSHIKIVMDADADKGVDKADNIGVEPIITKRKLSVSGAEKLAEPKEDKKISNQDNEYQKLQDEVSQLKLHISNSEETKGKKQAGATALYGQLPSTELKDTKFVYSLGTHIRLSLYSAAPHEDPNILIKKWEHELKKCGIPKCDWVMFVAKSLRETAHQWWELQGFCEDIAWEEFKARFQRAFGRVELRRWLAYAGNLCFSQANEAIGPYVMRRYQIVLRAVNQNQPLALKLLEKHVNMRIGRYLNFHSYEDFFFAMVADQVMDFDTIKLMFSQVLMEIRNDDRYWHDYL